jgi:hypothetical protein
LFFFFLCIFQGIINLIRWKVGKEIIVIHCCCHLFFELIFLYSNCNITLFFLYRWGLKPNVTLFCFVHTIRITLFNWSVNMESRSSAANVNGAYLDSLHLSIRMFTLYKKLIRSNWSYISVKRHTWTWLTSKLNLFSKHVLNWETILQFQKF